MHLGAGLVVLPGPPMQPGTLRLVGQPGPAALGRRVGDDGERPLHVGPVRIVDRGVELHDDRRRDADGLAVGKLELAVDLLGRVDGGERRGDRHGLAVAADHRTRPGVHAAVAQRLGGGESRPLPVQRTGHRLTVGVGQAHPLKPAVLDLQAHRAGRQDVLGCVYGREGQGGLGRRGC